MAKSAKRRARETSRQRVRRAEQRAVGVVPAPPSRVRHKLPVVGHMAPTAGPRDETCVNYSPCLTAHVRAHRARGESETDARCPWGCRWYREQEQAPATTFRSLNGEAHGLPDVAGCLPARRPK